MRITRALILPIFFGGFHLTLCRAGDASQVSSSINRPSPSTPALTNAAQFFGLSVQEANRVYPVQLEGVVMLVDSNRNLIVLQDASGALALNLEMTGNPLKPGERIRIEGAGSTLCSLSFPDYPAHPSEREIRANFEVPSNWGVYHLTRMRGFLRAPTTGDYNFWIASKGSAELWFSTNADPGMAVKIAAIPITKSTNPQQWSKYPSQSSAPIHLQAGDACYIEAVREHRGGSVNNLAVAWQGPGITQTVIEEKHLTPWLDLEAQPPFAQTNHGVLQEMWTNFFVGAVEPMTTRSPVKLAVTVQTPHISMLGRTNFPEALRVKLGDVVTRDNGYRWVEMEGTVVFAGKEGASVTLELTAGNARTRVRILDWPKPDWPRLENSRVRVRGVCEPAFTTDEKQVAGTIWVPSMAEVSELEPTGEDWAGVKLTSISELSPTNPDLAWGRRIRVRGTVVRQEGGKLSIEGAGSFWAYLSRDGLHWEQVARPVEIGMSEPVNVGLVATSLSVDSLTTAVFDHVEGLKDIRQQIDVSDSTPAGSASFTNGTFSVKGGGGGIGSAFDQFHFLHQPMSGSGDIVARVSSVEKSNPRANGGIMIRETLNAKSRFVAITITANGGALLQTRQKENERGEITEIRGYSAPCWLKLSRRYLGLTAYAEGSAPARVGQEVDVMGVLAWEKGQPVLREARCLNGAPDQTVQATLPRPTVGTDGAGVPDVTIADLIPTEGMRLKQGVGVARLRGVVTFSGRVAGVNYLAVEDATAGVFVRLSSRFARHPLLTGQLVELEVKSANGKWPVPFDPARISVLGWGQLPAPVSHPAEYSLPMRGEGRWVEMEGIVRSVASGDSLVVMGKEGILPVRIAQLAKQSLDKYVDALVRVRGVFARSDENAPMLLVPSPDFVEVKEPPPEEPFVIPAVATSDLKSLVAGASSLHRFKVDGVVTYREDKLVLVQDGSGGVRIRTLGEPAVNIGDGVEAVGFPEDDRGSVSLAGALLQKKERPPPLAPAQPSMEALLGSRLDATLVSIRGLLLEQQNHGAQQIFELQSGQRVFQAVLARRDGEVPSLPPGSQLELTGVCLAERIGGASRFNGGNPAVSSFQLLLRSPADVLLLERPPWWTWKHSAAVVGSLVLVLVGASIWIRQLHQRVAERTQALRATMAKLEDETKLSATLAERNRIAGEIHDGLEQGLNGVMMQLDGLETRLVRSPEVAKRHLDLARKMLRFSRTEVRHSLWDWKSPALAHQDFKTALTEIVTQMGHESVTQVDVQVSGDAHPLPPVAEHHLLRICQEALTNALKHAQARNIAVHLNFTDDAVELSVIDDGRGFVPETVLNGMVGHLGLQNLRSRARKLGGELTVTSTPEKGATISVRIPCPPGNPKAN